MSRFACAANFDNNSAHGTKSLYKFGSGEYNEYSKVDGARQVPRLGKGVDERTHLFCGASFGPLPHQTERLICRGIDTNANDLSHIGPFLQ